MLDMFIFRCDIINVEYVVFVYCCKYNDCFFVYFDYSIL